MRDDDRPAWSVRLQGEREKQGWNKHQLARRLYASIGIDTPETRQIKSLVRQIHWWERGDHFPRDWVGAYAATFQIDEKELFARSRPRGNVESLHSNDWDDDDVRRRALLLLLAGLGTTAATPREPLRRVLDLSLTSEPRDAEDWMVACADHLHAIRTRPPQQVHDDLLPDLLTVQRQITASATTDGTELQRVLAALSTLHANVLTRLGDHGSALRWWRTARDAADISGDLDLRVLVRDAAASFGLYGQRDPATVLHLIEKAQHIAGGRPSIGLIRTESTRAKALSLLGRHAEAKKALMTFVNAAPPDASPGLIPTYWTSDQVQFAESWVYAGAGEESAADEARDRLLTNAFTEYQYSANVRLHEALCTVVRGGGDRGAQQAATVFDTLPPSYHSQMIVETGRMVLRAVPADARHRPAVREYRDVLESAAQSLATPPPGPP